MVSEPKLSGQKERGGGGVWRKRAVALLEATHAWRNDALTGSQVPMREQNAARKKPEPNKITGKSTIEQRTSARKNNV